MQNYIPIMACPFCGDENIPVTENGGFFVHCKCFNLACKRFVQISVGEMNVESRKKHKRIAEFIRELAKFNKKKNEVLKVKCLFCGKETEVIKDFSYRSQIEFKKKSFRGCCGKVFKLFMQSRNPEEMFTPEQWRTYLLNFAENVENVKEIPIFPLR